MKREAFIILLFVSVFTSCLEPYNATVGDKASSLLVVNGLITNNNEAHSVVLTRSVSNINQPVIPVTDALVVIEDDLGVRVVLSETESGRYETDTCNFKGIPGRTYTLSIKTKEGEEYHSTPCLMLPSSRIDSIYYVPGKDLSTETDRTYNGISLYVSGGVDSDEIKYLRWSYKEDWKFEVPFYPDEVPGANGPWVPFQTNRYCWKSALSSDVALYSFSNQTGNNVIGKELYFINAKETDRLISRYSTLIEQYSISKEEYEFWKKLDQSAAGIGNIFGEQPFSITGNVKNINNPDEDVLGYFQVAGYASKRIYINSREMYKLRIPIKNSFVSCVADSFLIAKLNKIAVEQNTPIFQNMFDIYEQFVLKKPGVYQLAYPIYNETGKKIIGLALSTPQCTDCALSGNPEPPPFWEEKY